MATPASSSVEDEKPDVARATRINERNRQEGATECREGVTGDTRNARRDPEVNVDRGTERGPCGYAERIRRGERVSKERLKGHACGRERGAGEETQGTRGSRDLVRMRASIGSSGSQRRHRAARS